ncbi:hypothetical protein [Actinomyces trachealis]|uniref:hypothetical protein n=1 Tax=Actinomyces trachealis TaxID=2763540 RepID=UPI0018C828AC|nr:hypothetical protein [Actinomyces trachealis]
MSTENPSRPEDTSEEYGQSPEPAATVGGGEQQPIKPVESAQMAAKAVESFAQAPSAAAAFRTLDGDEPLVLPESMVLPEGVNLEELAQSMDIPSMESDPTAKTVAVTPELLRSAENPSSMDTQRLDSTAKHRRPLFPMEAADPSREQSTVNLTDQDEVVPPMPNPALQPEPLDASLPPVPAPPQWDPSAETLPVNMPVGVQEAAALDTDVFPTSQVGTEPAQPVAPAEAFEANSGAASPNSLSAWSERTAAPEPVAEANQPAETVIGMLPSLAAEASFGVGTLGLAGTASSRAAGLADAAGAGATTPGLEPAAIPGVAPAPPASSPTSPSSQNPWLSSPATVPTKQPRSDADVLLEGSSVVGRPASRAAWHWGGALIAVVLFPFAWYLCHAGKARLADNLPTPGGPFVPGVDVFGLLEVGGGLLALLVALLVARKSASGPFVVGIISLALGVPFLVLPGATWDLLAPMAIRLTDQSTLGANLVRFFIMDGYTGTFVLIGLAMIVVGVVAHSTRRAGRREREILSRAKR